MLNKIQFTITTPTSAHNTYGFEFFFINETNEELQLLMKDIDNFIRMANFDDQLFKSLGVFFQGGTHNWKYYEFLGTSIHDIKKQDIIMKYCEIILEKFDVMFVDEFVIR